VADAFDPGEYGFDDRDDVDAANAAYLDELMADGSVTDDDWVIDESEQISADLAANFERDLHAGPPIMLGDGLPDFLRRWQLPPEDVRRS
jgi:hypothetical protein